MLNLLQRVSTGRFREVYLHPNDNTKLIKISPLQYQKKIPFTFFNRVFLKNKPNKHSPINRELMGIEFIKSKALNYDSFFTKFYGQVETNLGAGIVVERISNFYFNEAPTVYDYLLQHRKIIHPELSIAVTEFFNFLLAQNFYCAGGAPENIAITRKPDGGMSLKAFDAKVYFPKNIFALAQWHQKKLRRIKKQASLVLEQDWTTPPYSIKKLK